MHEVISEEVKAIERGRWEKQRTSEKFEEREREKESRNGSERTEERKRKGMEGKKNAQNGRKKMERICDGEEARGRERVFNDEVEEWDSEEAR